MSAGTSTGTALPLTLRSNFIWAPLKRTLDMVIQAMRATYNKFVSGLDPTAFVRRDWAALAWAKEQHWLRLSRTLTPAEQLWRIDELARYARSIRCTGQPAADRLADVRIHQRVGQALRAVSSTLR